MEVIFYLCIIAFVAVCWFKPNLIIGLGKDGNAKSEEGANKKEVP